MYLLRSCSHFLGLCFFFSGKAGKPEGREAGAPEEGATLQETRAVGAAGSRGEGTAKGVASAGLRLSSASLEGL